MAPRSLADVEWQSVMHFLPSSDLLRLGRCSKPLSPCASTPFAWSCTVLRVASAPKDLKERLAYKHALFKAAPLALVLLPPYGCNRAQLLSKAQSDKLRGMHLWQLHTLDCTAFYSSPPDLWHSLLDARSALRHLRVLIIHNLRRNLRPKDVDAEMIRLIATMPRLHTLQIDPNELEPTALNPLASAPALTDLRISSEGRDCRLAQIGACSLQSLLLDAPHFTGSSFRSFFAAPIVQHLRCLTLRHAFICRPQADPVGGDDLCRGMSALVALRELRLIECDHLVPLMPHLLCLPILELLVFQLESWHSSHAVGSYWPYLTIPRMSDISPLMEAKAQLRCVINLSSTAFRKPDGDEALRVWCQPLITRFGDRAELKM